MHAELERRILRAVIRCTARLHRRPYRQPEALQPSKKEVKDHGPGVIGRQLKRTLEQLILDREVQPTPEESDLEACRALLSPFIKTRTVTLVTTERPSHKRLSFPVMLEERLLPAVLTGRSLGLIALGTIFEIPRAVLVGSVEAWDRCGFYTFLDLLLAAYPNPSADRFEKIATNARLLAYILHALEHASALDDLRPLKCVLSALAAGAVPVAYDPHTQTLYVGNWY